jgi:hypothetical protein
VLAVDPYLVVMRDAVRFADGGYGLYSRLLVPGGAAILPVLGNSIALFHRFRHGTRRRHIAIALCLSGIPTPDETHHFYLARIEAVNVLSVPTVERLSAEGGSPMARRWHYSCARDCAAICSRPTTTIT